MADITIPYAPRPLQRAFHDAFERQRPRASCLVVHRRFGKSVMAINEVLRQAIRCTEPRPRFAYMAPLYKQAKEIAWDYLRQYAGAIPGTTFNESELRADLPNGARIKLLGAENADSLRGIYLDGVVLDEYAYMQPDVFASVVRPALADRKGFAIFLGTPLGRNHFHALYEKLRVRQDAVTALWRASETQVLDAEELEAARVEMTPELYAQEFECSFEAAIQGAYYARELEAARSAGRIRAFEWEPALSVDTYWDLGLNDSTVILFTQRAGREIRIVETYDNRGQSLDHYAHVLQSRPYVYGRHYLPHDVEVRELTSGKSRLDFLTALGVRPITVLGANDVQDGIAQARLLFPRVWINEPKCRGLVDALGAYRAEWDAKKMVFKDQPLHDWASHYADAFRYLAIAVRDRSEAERHAGHQRSTVDFSPFRLSEPRQKSRTAFTI